MATTATSGSSSATRSSQNVSDLAALYLKAINAPDTPNNRRVVASWMGLESGFTSGSSKTRINVVGNNPLNITGVGTCGSRTYAAHRFKVYCTPQDAAADFSRLLNNNPRYGYTKIVAGLRNNDANAALAAIINSSWTPTHYQHGNTNSLLGVFKSLGGNISDFAQAPNPVGDTLTSLSEWQQVLQKLGINSDPSHIFTPEEAMKIATSPKSAGGYGLSGSVADSVAKSFAGKSVKDSLPYKNTSFDPIKAVGDTTNLLGDVVKTATDPFTWLKVLAVVAGLLLLLLGAWFVVKDTFKSD